MWAGRYGRAETDRAALVALYHTTGGPEWTNNRLWLNEREPLDSWFGVATNSEGRVTELELGYPGNNLTGLIPSELGSLSELKRLELTYNRLDGTIPPELGNLSNLEHLGLTYNRLDGPIPPELGNLSNPEVLNLAVNELTGPIPPELGNLSNLESLNFVDNRLTGPIPPELGNLSNLELLRLDANRLTGELPVSLMQADLDYWGYVGNYRLCMPWLDSMQNWRREIKRVEGPNCPR